MSEMRPMIDLLRKSLAGAAITKRDEGIEPRGLVLSHAQWEAFKEDVGQTFAYDDVVIAATVTPIAAGMLHVTGSVVEETNEIDR